MRSRPSAAVITATSWLLEVARETYGVEHVIARIYDPKRAAVYQRLGIPTVATVTWTATQIMKALLPTGASEEFTDPTGTMTLAEVPLDQQWFGRNATELERQTGARIAFVTRYGGSGVARSGTCSAGGRLRAPTIPTRRSRADRRHRAVPREGQFMRVAIAGAGKVGRAIARELLQNGHEILLLDRDAALAKPGIVEGAETLMADACEITALEEARLSAMRRCRSSNGR